MKVSKRTDEISVRPVTRYVVAHFHTVEYEGSDACAGGSQCYGEYDNLAHAEKVAAAMAASIPGAKVVER